MKIVPYGDTALLVIFDEKIDEKINQRVLSIYQGLKGNKEVKYLIPAYHSLTIGIFRDKTNFSKLYALIEKLNNQQFHQTLISKTQTIPVCYEGVFAPDLEEVSQLTNLSKKQVIEKHSEQTYHVFMLGFLAGFAYMGKLNEELHCPRKATPRLSVPKGSVGLAGNQTGIYPAEAPGGWQIIGRTPINLFNVEKPPFTHLKAGDKVQFRPISLDEYKLIELKIETGIYQPEFAHD